MNAIQINEVLFYCSTEVNFTYLKPKYTEESVEMKLFSDLLRNYRILNLPEIVSKHVSRIDFISLPKLHKLVYFATISLITDICKDIRMTETSKPGEVSNVHRSSLELRQLGKAPRPKARSGFHWEVPKSNNFAGHSARRDNSEIYSLAVDIEDGLVGREIQANIYTSFYCPEK